MVAVGTKAYDLMIGLKACRKNKDVEVEEILDLASAENPYSILNVASYAYE